MNWHCHKCNNFKSSSKPIFNTLCDKKIKTFSPELFQKAWFEEEKHNIEIPDIEQLNDFHKQYIIGNYSVHEIFSCDGTCYYSKNDL